MTLELLTGATLVITAAALGGHSLADRRWIEGGLLLGSSVLLMAAYKLGV